MQNKRRCSPLAEEECRDTAFDKNEALIYSQLIRQSSQESEREGGRGIHTDIDTEIQREDIGGTKRERESVCVCVCVCVLMCVCMLCICVRARASTGVCINGVCVCVCVCVC